jgi:chromosome segregation ATPase
MTYEEMQRMMEFILEQQAQLTANQQRSDERAARADERADRANERIARADERINRANKLITELQGQLTGWRRSRSNARLPCRKNSTRNSPLS